MKANCLILFFLLGLLFIASNGKLVRREMNVIEVEEFAKSNNLIYL